MEYLKQDEIESRTYQEVIAVSAVQKNTLVVLPTGLGKTVIAAMTASKKLEEGKIMFLAPTKPLVQQHKRSFNKFLEVDEEELQIMTGDTSPRQREKLWKTKKIFFATPQVVENDLISQKIPKEDFSFVIFDEAHRATGDYSYVFISNKLSGLHRMALTASPGGSKEKIEEVAENLEINNFEIRTEEDPDVKPYIEEKNVQWKKVKLSSQFEKAKQHLDKAYRKQLKKLKSQGHLNKTSNIHKTELLKLRNQLSARVSTEDDPKIYSGLSHVAAALKISQAIELLETQGTTQAYEYLEGLETDESKAAKKALNDQDVQKAKSIVTYLKKRHREHPKLDKLVEILGNMESDEKAIVFTEYRASTNKIVEELNDSGQDAVKFVGQQGDDGMSQTEQIETLAEFDQDKYNVLVSTSIGEEGLDIPAVDYVLFYEPIPSGIRDIQRMGRTGRQEEGEVIVLMAENTRDEASYWSAYHKKRRMNETLQQLKNEDFAKPDNQKTLESNFNKKQEKEKEQENNIKIIVDDRENSIAKEISKKDIGLDKKRLDVADFIVSDRTAVERKKAEDFVDSLLDQRLFEQLNELEKNYENPLILIEGKNLFSHRDIHPNAVRGALSTIAIDYGITITWTKGKDETVEQLISFAKREQEEKEREVQIRGSKGGTTLKDEQEFIVAGLPGINTKIAKRLLQEFGSIRKIFTASKQELKQVKGIGEKKAEKIIDILQKQYS